jgi:hypothetical protein
MYYAMKTYPYFNQVPRHEDVSGNEGTVPRIINIGVRLV